MNKVRIVTDGCSDLPEEWRERYGIDVAPLTLVWGGEQRTVSDGEFFSVDEFYDAMRNGVKMDLDKTPENAFAELFGRYSGDTVIYIGCSSAMSAVYSVGAAVAARLNAEGADIRAVDCKASGGAQGLMACEAAKLAATGADADSVVELVAELSAHIRQVGTTDDLEYLKRSGRVKASTAFFGNLFGIKPIIVSDASGMYRVAKKVKGKRNALDECVDTFKKLVCYPGNPMPITEQTVYIGNADCADDAEYCAARIASELAPKDIMIHSIGPGIGSMVGPTAVALFGFGKPTAEQ